MSTREGVIRNKLGQMHQKDLLSDFNETLKPNKNKKIFVQQEGAYDDDDFD